MNYSSKFRLFHRILCSPIIFLLLFVGAMIHFVRRFILYIRFGGEFSTYEATDAVTMQDIYYELKNQKDGTDTL